MNKPNMFDSLIGPILTCGYPWGAEGICYPTGNQIYMYYAQFQMNGKMFPGMSGGPVMDVGNNAIIAVNTAVTGGGPIIVSPLIGLFETLGVEVLK
jgi:hypothetical protein